MATNNTRMGRDNDHSRTSEDNGTSRHIFLHIVKVPAGMPGHVYITATNEVSPACSPQYG